MYSRGGARPPRPPSGYAPGDTRMKYKNLWLNVERTVDNRGRTAKKVITLQKKGRQFFTALQGMQTRSYDEISVRLSVRLSVCLSVCQTRAL